MANIANIADITITGLETIDVFDLVSKNYRFTLDELQNTTIANTQETQDITGKGGRKLSSLKKNKGVTVSGTNGLVSGGLLSVQTGGKFDHKDSTPIMWSETLTVSSDTVTIGYNAVGTVGAEITAVVVKHHDGAHMEELTQDATAGEGKFAFDPDSKIITFESGVFADGTEVTVLYKRNVEGCVLSNVSDVYSEKCEMFINAMGEDVCGRTYRIQFHIPKADFNGNFDITLGDNQTVHAFEANSLAGTCGAAGTLWDYTVFGV